MIVALVEVQKVADRQALTEIGRILDGPGHRLTAVFGWHSPTWEDGTRVAMDYSW